MVTLKNSPYAQTTHFKYLILNFFNYNSFLKYLLLSPVIFPILTRCIIFKQVAFCKKNPRIHFPLYWHIHHNCVYTCTCFVTFSDIFNLNPIQLRCLIRDWYIYWRLILKSLLQLPLLIIHWYNLRSVTLSTSP